MPASCQLYKASTALLSIIPGVCQRRSATETGALQVGQLTRNSTNPAIAKGQVVLRDAKWHMVTLTTLWDGTPGYAMMIDGRLAGVLDGNSTYTGDCPSHFSAIELLLEPSGLTPYIYQSLHDPVHLGTNPR